MKRKVTIPRVLSILALALLIPLIACAPSVPSSAGEERAPASSTEPLTTTPAETADRTSPSDTVPRITIDELRRKMESKADILIVDNRHKEEYDIDRIKGAVLAPLDTILAGGWLSPQGKELILY